MVFTSKEYAAFKDQLKDYPEFEFEEKYQKLMCSSRQLLIVLKSNALNSLMNLRII